ncbi:cytochrome b5 domain-containing protein [Thermococcus peptonophilus]|uniref:cytochrome b5 domain-containing protein n=1 Tax=Thermococcus peptonophilus TaxID=53952 RepID=UPI0006D1978C
MGGLTLEEVAKHSTENDCWVVIGNDVYNVTSLIDTHSGGKEAIIQYCGTNATDVFFSKHSQRLRGSAELLHWKHWKLAAGGLVWDRS